MLGSFRIRLIIAFIALFAAVSVAVSFAGSMLREQQVRSIFDRDLHLRAEVLLGSVLKSPRIDDAVLAESLKALSETVYFRDSFVQVYNEREQSVARSSNLGDSVMKLSRPFADKSMDDVVVDAPTPYQLPTGKVRMRGLRVRFEGTDGHDYIAIVAANAGLMTESIRVTRWLFFGGNIGGLAAAAAAAWFVTGAMSRRLGELVQQIEQVGPEKLDFRIEIRDRDEIADLARHINSALDRLKAGFDTQERFIHDASHELKTPVATVQAEAQAMLLSDPTREELIEFASNANDEMRRLGRLTEALLLLTRTDERVLLDRFKPLDISESATAAVRHLSSMACDHVVRLTFSSTDPKDDALLVRCDPDLLEAMVSNLVRNAIRFSPRSGQVQIGIERIDNEVAVTVDDDGPGIPDDVLPHIFDRYFVSSERKVRRGAGLGLAIASTVARLHDGSISASNRSGGGARFTVRLPLYQQGRSDTTA